MGDDEHEIVQVQIPYDLNGTFYPFVGHAPRWLQNKELVLSKTDSLPQIFAVIIQRFGLGSEIQNVGDYGI